MRHAIVTGIVLFAALGRADEASGRAVVERTIGALSAAADEADIRELATAKGYDDVNQLFLTMEDLGPKPADHISPYRKFVSSRRMSRWWTLPPLSTGPRSWWDGFAFCSR